MKNLGAKLALIWKNKKIRYFTIGGVVLLLTCVWGVGYLTGRAVPVSAAAIEQIEDVFYEEGVVKAQTRSVISADVTAKAQEIIAKEGQHVKKGDILLKLDTSGLLSQRDILMAEKDTLLAAFDQNRDQLNQQIAALEAQSAGYSSADVGNLYNEQILLLDQSMDPYLKGSVAWSMKELMNVTQKRMGQLTAAEDMTIQSQLDAAKVQKASVQTQLEQYKLTLSSSAASDAVTDTYDNMIKVVDEQITRLTQALTGPSYQGQIGVKNELAALEEQYYAFIYNTKSQILALTAQQEQAAAAYAGANRAKKQINQQIDILEGQLSENSGTANYYAAQLQRVEASIKEIERQIESCNIAAPHDGIVGAIDLQSGAYVTLASPITEIVDKTNMQVECMLLTEDAHSIIPGMDAVIIWEQRGMDIEYPCKVKSVSSMAVLSMSAVGLKEQRVKVILEPKFNDDDINPGDGFLVRVRFILKSQSGVVIPQSAVVQSEYGDAVYVMQKGKAVLTPVKLGLSSGDKVAVEQGITDEDKVVENPEESGVKDGEPIKAAN